MAMTTARASENRELKRASCLRPKAIRQHGLITRQQAEAGGLSPRQIDLRLERVEWVRVHPGVYRLAEALPDFHQQLLAACLWAGEGSVVSHRGAAGLCRFEGIEPGFIEITTTKPGKRTRTGITLHRTSRLEPYDITKIDGIPVTSPSRTIIDLAGVVDALTLEIAFDSALRRGLITVDRIERRLRLMGRRGRHGVASLLDLLEDRAENPATDSLLEIHLLRLIHRYELPTPIRQYRISGVGRIDLAYPDARVAIEADGYGSHSQPDQFQRDRERDNSLSNMGWRVLRFTWRDVLHRSEYVTETIRRALDGNS